MQCHLESQTNRIFYETQICIQADLSRAARSLAENDALESGDPATGAQTKVGSKGRQGGNQFK